jgi:hypothetical protein
MMLTFVRKVLGEHRLKHRWKCRNQIKEMLQQEVQSIVDVLPGKRAGRTFRAISVQSLQTKLYEHNLKRMPRKNKEFSYDK